MTATRLTPRRASCTPGRRAGAGNRGGACGNMPQGRAGGGLGTALSAMETATGDRVPARGRRPAVRTAAVRGPATPGEPAPQIRLTLRLEGR